MNAFRKGSIFRKVSRVHRKQRHKEKQKIVLNDICFSCLPSSSFMFYNGFKKILHSHLSFALFDTQKNSLKCQFLDFF